MGKHWMMGLVAVVAVVAVGGIGFAAFTTSAYINATAQAGTLGPLYWSDASEPAPTESFDACNSFITTTLNTSDTFDFTAGNLAPGDSCTFSANLNNGGSIPAAVSITSTSDVGAGCSVTYTFDNWFGYESYGVTHGTETIGGGSYQTYTVSESLGAGLGNADQGVVCDITLTFTASAGV